MIVYSGSCIRLHALRIVTPDDSVGAQVPVSRMSESSLCYVPDRGWDELESCGFAETEPEIVSSLLRNLSFFLKFLFTNKVRRCQLTHSSSLACSDVAVMTTMSGMNDRGVGNSVSSRGESSNPTAQVTILAISSTATSVASLEGGANYILVLYRMFVK